MERLTAHLPPGTALDAAGNAPWPHPTIVADDPDPKSGRIGAYKAILGRSGVSSDIQVVDLPFTRPAEGGRLLAGLTNEALLAVVLHRLEGLQRGEGACPENASAAYHVEIALDCLHKRSTRIGVAKAAENEAQANLTRLNGDDSEGSGTDLDQPPADLSLD